MPAYFTTNSIGGRTLKFPHYVLITCLFSAWLAQAADPFDRTQRQSSENLQPRVQRSHCTFSEPSLAAESDFEQLKLVGVVLYKTSPEALFLDMRQQLIIAKQGNRLGQEGYLLQKISKQGVQLLRSKQGQCEQSEPFEIRF